MPSDLTQDPMSCLWEHAFPIDCQIGLETQTNQKKKKMSQLELWVRCRGTEPAQMTNPIPHPYHSGNGLSYDSCKL